MRMRGWRLRGSGRQRGVLATIMGGIGLIHPPHGVNALRLHQVPAGSLDIELRNLALDDFQGTGRTGADAVTEPVAELFLDQLRLAIDQLQRAFRATGDAIAAAVACRLVYRDNLPYRHDVLPSWFIAINGDKTIAYCTGLL
jgi:hypothetical protein